MNSGSNGNKYVNFRVFFGVIGIITCVLGWVISSNASTNGRINTINGDVGEIKGDIKTINSNIGWIREALAGLKYQAETP